MERINWHRMFGLLLTDFFTGSSYIVEMEKDLSKMKQLLDVVVVRKGSKELAEPVPDGMEDMAPHNLITFKSFHEALDDWVFKELTGHFVNYRKQVSDSLDHLLPEEDFRLYAIEGLSTEGLNMPYTMQDFLRECAKEHLKDLSPDERLAGLSPEERLKGLPPEERLKGLPPEERLKGLAPEEIERYLQRIKADSSSQKRKKKK